MPPNENKSGFLEATQDQKIAIDVHNSPKNVVFALGLDQVREDVANNLLLALSRRVMKQEIGNRGVQCPTEGRYEIRKAQGVVNDATTDSLYEVVNSGVIQAKCGSGAEKKTGWAAYLNRHHDLGQLGSLCNIASKRPIAAAGDLRSDGRMALRLLQRNEQIPNEGVVLLISHSTGLAAWNCN